MSASSRNYCYECAEWFLCDLAWDHHCNQHLQDLDMFCGELKWRYSVILPAKCPFCLGSSDLAAAKRYQQFSDINELQTHLVAHFVTSFPQLQRCPHPCCEVSITSIDELCHHFKDYHHVPISTQSLQEELDSALEKNWEVLERLKRADWLSFKVCLLKCLLHI